MSEPIYAWEVADDFETRIRAAEDRAGSLAADLLEEQAQRRELGEALVRVTQERDDTRTERDNLAADMARLTQLMEATDRTDEARRVRLSEVRAERDEARAERNTLLEDVANGAVLADQLHRERDEARAEVVRLGRSLEEWKAALRETFDYRIKMIAQHRKALDEVVRLRTIIGELGAAEAAEPQEEIEALRPEGCPAHGVHPHNGMRCLDCPECGHAN